jgi:polysaccharide export outer membrane protein
MGRRFIAILFPIALALCAPFSLTAEPENEGAARKGSSSFLIGIEDVLEIVTWDEPDLTLTVKVRPDGMIALPLVNEIEAVGRTPEQLRLRIVEEMTKYIRDPNVTVLVSEINSYRVFFLGEVATQGPLQFYQPTRLLQGIASAGGLTEFAKKSITVLREEGGIEKRIEVDYKKLWAGELGHENIYLRPGDTVLVK